MAKNFTDVCASASKVEEYFDRMMKVYKVLKETNEPLTPAEIALKLGWKYCDGTGVAAKVVHPLYWLYRMELVDRESYKREIKLDNYENGHWERDVQIIDGKKYIHEEWVTDDSAYYVKVVTSYRWFIKK